MFRMWKRHRELKRRAEQARQGADDARQRLHRSREEVVKPLRSAAEHNQFARIIRDSLLGGDQR